MKFISFAKLDRFVLLGRELNEGATVNVCDSVVDSFDELPFSGGSMLSFQLDEARVIAISLR